MVSYILVATKANVAGVGGVRFVNLFQIELIGVFTFSPSVGSFSYLM